jgi:hypothetical protein
VSCGDSTRERQPTLCSLISVLQQNRALFNFFVSHEGLSFTVCVNDALPVDNSVFCSGDFVIVLATEQDFAFRINDLHAVPVVPAFLGGMARACVFCRTIKPRDKCKEKTLRLTILYFSTRTEHTLYTIYSK